MPTLLKNWVNVPPGSELTVKVSGEVPSSGTWQRERNSDGTLLESGTASDTMLHQTWMKHVDDDQTVSMDLALTFVDAAQKSATVEAQVTKPDGSVHGKPFKHTATGKAGDAGFNYLISARAR